MGFFARMWLLQASAAAFLSNARDDCPVWASDMTDVSYWPAQRCVRTVFLSENSAVNFHSLDINAENLTPPELLKLFQTQ